MWPSRRGARRQWPRSRGRILTAGASRWQTGAAADRAGSESSPPRWGCCAARAAVTASLRLSRLVASGALVSFERPRTASRPAMLGRRSSFGPARWVYQEIPRLADRQAPSRHAPPPDRCYAAPSTPGCCSRRSWTHSRDQDMSAQGEPAGRRPGARGGRRAARPSAQRSRGRSRPARANREGGPAMTRIESH